MPYADTYQFQPVSIGSSTAEVKIVEARVKRGYATVRNGFVVIKVPAAYSDRRKRALANDLYKMIVRAAAKDPSRFARNSDLVFRDMQKVSLFGTVITVKVIARNARSGAAKVSGDLLLIKVPLGKEGDTALVSKLAARGIGKHFEQHLDGYVRAINSATFKSKLGRVRIRNGLTVLGSCSPKNDITINERLLFTDIKFLNYVIMHELAHTVVRSHSNAFWKALATYVPDFKRIRKELRDAGRNVETEYKEAGEEAAIKAAEVKP
ncbi:MAG: M48 family metallopeptidase [Candidatus Marsarchaeota archaeon]|nr:M48 family metallopeptidase [Candidatus Marsarchaeota archaeon]